MATSFALLIVVFATGTAISTDLRYTEEAVCEKVAADLRSKEPRLGEPFVIAKCVPVK